MSLPEEFREKAKAMRKLANDLIDQRPLISLEPVNPGVENSEEYFKCDNLVTAIVGHLTASIYEIQAQSLDYLRLTSAGSPHVKRRLEILERNDAVRRAAASENWDEFDRLVAGGELERSEPEGATGTGQ